LNKALGQLFIILMVLLFLQSVQAAGMPQLSSQQIQQLKQQYLGAAGKQEGATKNNQANEIADQQQAVQPQAAPVIAAPSVIEASMRARLSSDLKESVKEDAPNNLKNSDLAAPEKAEKREMADSRKEDLNLRSSWERFLQDRKVRGVDGNLSQFGYQLFSGSPNTFTPAADIPVPPEYVLGPGDELQMQFYGSRDDSMNLVIDREGVIELPKVGALTLVGLSFVQAKALIAEQVRQKMIGVTASVTMGRLRSIRVFVLGDAEHPGSYLISGLSTISHALFSAGGVSKKGSLRHIQLKRNSKVVKELDLYDFLLKGNSRGDERLLPGDVIFIPPVGAVIGVAGQVNRPAIYELRAEKTAQEITEMAGGVLADADLKHLQIDRLSQAGDRNILDFDFKQSTKIQNGDILMLFAVPGMRTDTVGLLGHIKRPGQYGLAKDMKLSSLINSVDDLLPGAFLDYALIQRTDPISRNVATLRVSLDRLLVKQDKHADVALQADDQVYVFSKSSIDPLNVVSIFGQIVNPGQYPYAEKMRLIDLVLAAGGPNEQSYLKVAELTRYEVIDGKRRQSSHIEVNLADALAGNADANILMMPHDELLIRTISNWRSTTSMSVQGEVKYPATYSVTEGEHLSDILVRAGGYTDEAYLRAAVFTRQSVRAEQQKQIEELAKRTEAEVARMEDSVGALKDDLLRTRQIGKLEAAKRIADQMKSVRATGRIVIELADIEKLKGTSFDLTLRDGDNLYVPKRPDEVQVLGEVYNQTAFVYQKDVSGADYLAMAGGATRSGDAQHTYVIRANGMLDVVNKGWFGVKSIAVEPGDSIVVPQEVEQFNLLDSTLDWSRVVMQVGVSLASMKTIGIFK
jgi:polysaccharide biosynthesis/export protein